MQQDTGVHLITTASITLPIANEDASSSTMGAYLAYPAVPGHYPGIIVCFELFGLTSYIRRTVERLAQSGYVVIAPDFYHRTAPGIELEATAEGRSRGFALLHQLTRTQAMNDVQAAIAYLRKEKQCAHIGMVGLSVGGHIAYLAATQFDLRATVVFYPGWLSVQDIPLSQPVPTLTLTPSMIQHNGYLLFLVGEQDPLIPALQREAIASALRSAHVRHELVVYPEATHGFFCDERETFQPDAAADAWQRISKLFTTELSSTN